MPAAASEPPINSSGWLAIWNGPRTPRMLDVNYQTSLLPQSADAALRRAGAGCSSISELGGDYARRHGGEVSARNVMQEIMVADEQNPSSIRSPDGRGARERAGMCAGTLTTEVWETQNRDPLESSSAWSPRASSRRIRAALSKSSARTCARRHVVGNDAAGRGLPLPVHGSFPSAPTTRRGCSTSVPRRRPERRRGAGLQGADSGRDVEYDFYHWSAILRR